MPFWIDLHAMSVDSPHESESVPLVPLTWSLNAALRAVRAGRAGVVGAAVEHAPLTAHLPLAHTHFYDSHTAFPEVSQVGLRKHVAPVSVLHASLRCNACSEVDSSV